MLIIGKIIKINPSNKEYLLSCKEALVKDREKLIKQMSKHPVEIIFDKPEIQCYYRFVLDKEQELDSLIYTMDIKIKAFDLEE